MFALNPGYNRMTTPPKGPHRLLLPIPNAQTFRQAMLDQSLVDQSSVAVVAVEPPPEVRHKVRRGETLSAIARQYGVPMAGPAAGQRHPWFGDPSGRFAADSGRIRRLDRDAGRAGRTA